MGRLTYLLWWKKGIGRLCTVQDRETYFLTLVEAVIGRLYTRHHGTVGGIEMDKQNVAIAAKEQSMLKDLMQVPDEQGLTVWGDGEVQWQLMKKYCFLTKDDRVWKYVGVNNRSVVGSILSRDNSCSFVSPDNPGQPPGISGKMLHK